MKPFPHTAELAHLAKRLEWFKSAGDALKDPYHFVAHVLTFGTFEDVTVLRQHLSTSDLKDAIDHAPPGIFDSRSWNYWNLMIGRYPAPPLPKRKL